MVRHANHGFVEPYSLSLHTGFPSFWNHNAMTVIRVPFLVSPPLLQRTYDRAHRVKIAAVIAGMAGDRKEQLAVGQLLV
jgi:hypothetical protein